MKALLGNVKVCEMTIRNKRESSTVESDDIGSSSHSKHAQLQLVKRVNVEKRRVIT